MEWHLLFGLPDLLPDCFGSSIPLRSGFLPLGAEMRSICLLLCHLGHVTIFCMVVKLPYTLAIFMIYISKSSVLFCCFVLVFKKNVQVIPQVWWQSMANQTSCSNIQSLFLPFCLLAFCFNVCSFLLQKLKA